VRGYLAGSGLKEYNASGSVCGIKITAGLKNSSKLPQPIFTPSTKEGVGVHDINIDSKTGAKLVGGEQNYKTIEETAIKLYTTASDTREPRESYSRTRNSSSGYTMAKSS